MVASLPSLPNELLFMICNEVHPLSNHSHGGLHALGALSRTNRRLNAAIGPILYDRGVKCHSHLPLLWAAKFNLPGTLAGALAAGADPNHSFTYPVSRKVWDLANDTHHASRAWANHEPTYWPPMPIERAASLRGPGARWRRDMTPDLIQLDVHAPTLAIPTNSTPRYNDAAGASSFEPDDQLSAYSDQGSDSEANPGTGSDDDGSSSQLGPEQQDGHLMRTYTALHLAAREGHNDTVRMLLDRGALIDSPCRYFCGCRAPKSLWETLAAAEPDPWTTRGPRWECRNQTPLHIAICSSRFQTAKLLVLRGAQVARGFDALHQAAAAGYTDLAEYILDIRPELDVDEPDEKGLTPFYYAFANRRWDSTVPLLLARGANIDAGFEVRRRPGRLTTTPLGEACRLGRFEDALKLIDLGADVALGVLQEIPLPRLPRDDGNSDVHRARPPAEVSKTRIPLLHVCSMDFSSDKNLYSWSTSVWEPSSLQTFSRPMLIARLVAAGLSPDLKRDPGTGHPETPLSIAVCHLNVPAVRALLDAGADVNTPGPHARSPLMLATTLSACHHCQWRYGDEYWGGCHLLHCSQYYAKPPEAPDRWRIARLLLDAGARVNDQDPEGNTALHLLFLPGNETQSPWSRIADDGARRQFLRLLLARGADPCSRNGSGKSVLRLLVEYAETEALETISAQCRIDLADCLPVDEIIAIFAAMPGRESRWDPPSDRAGSADVGGFVDERAPCRLPDALLSMDSSGGVAANLPSICRSLLDSKRLGPAADVIEILCSRGLDKGLFSLETKQALLPFALQLERWQMAYQLLDELPHVRDINAPVAGNLTPLSLVTLSATFHRTGSPGVDIQLVEAGANVHLPLASGLTHLCDARADVGVVTPLKQALVYPSAFNIDWMLHRQPIRGNPQAAAARYLHFVVASTWRKQLPEWARPPDVTWYVREETIRTLFAAGADTAQLDDESNTPLSALLHELDEDTHRLRHVCHWFKPLSRGVDINHRNKKGLSIADYLDGILKVPRAAKILNLYLELVTLESGKRDIKWLK